MYQTVDQSQCDEMNILIFIQLLVLVYAQTNNGNTAPARTQKVPLMNKPSRDNPRFIRDRLRNIIIKPEMPPTWTGRHQQLYDSNWMDYCDPYHCGDYHRNICGLNRKKMRFKWFQSVCHLILNNQCSSFRGALKYDMIETKHCNAYVMFLRAGCPQHHDCHEYKFKPLCAMSSVDGHTVIFQNECFLDAMNCRNSTLQEYDVVRMSLCENLLDARNSNEEEAKNEEKPLIYKLKLEEQI